MGRVDREVRGERGRVKTQQITESRRVEAVGDRGGADDCAYIGTEHSPGYQVGLAAACTTTLREARGLTAAGLAMNALVCIARAAIVFSVQKNL